MVVEGADQERDSEQVCPCAELCQQSNSCVARPDSQLALKHYALHQLAFVVVRYRVQPLCRVWYDQRDALSSTSMVRKGIAGLALHATPLRGGGAEMLDSLFRWYHVSAGTSLNADAVRYRAGDDDRSRLAVTQRGSSDDTAGRLNLKTVGPGVQTLHVDGSLVV